jgi:hypothetical protein
MPESLLQEAERMLAGTRCPCGKIKLPNKSFCGPCYFRLPSNLRLPLRSTGVEYAFVSRCDYASAWDEARDWLRFN